MQIFLVLGGWWEARAWLMAEGFTPRRSPFDRAYAVRVSPPAVAYRVDEPGDLHGYSPENATLVNPGGDTPPALIEAARSRGFEVA